MLRHAIAVAGLSVVFVAALMYCITPDLVDASVSAAGYRARQFFSSISGHPVAPDATGGTSVQSPVSRSRRGAVSDFRIGPDPFQP